MECRKLSEEETAEWLDMDEVPFDESPLKGRMDANLYDLIASICDFAASDFFDAMHKVIGENPAEHARGMRNETFAALQKRAYEHAVACGDANSCCDLANMYHDTDNLGAKEDYATAIELYELGASRGEPQSSVNLGYIYYYGRGVERDYSQAYKCFARAALLTDHPEALWKLGDLYASGKGVAQSDRVAWSLYVKAYENAGDSPMRCRAAHHVADYLLKGIDGFLEPNPDGALALYNEAEIGYYAAIDTGLDYYERQLKQVIEGQLKARIAVQAKHRRIRAGK
jgi:TPR repeat protein